MLNKSLSLYSSGLSHSGTKQLMVAIDFHSMEKYHRSQWLPSTVRSPTYFEWSSFVFNSRKKLIQVCGWVNDDRIFFWGVSYLLDRLKQSVFLVCCPKNFFWRFCCSFSLSRRRWRWRRMWRRTCVRACVASPSARRATASTCTARSRAWVSSSLGGPRLSGGARRPEAQRPAHWGDARDYCSLH